MKNPLAKRIIKAEVEENLPPEEDDPRQLTLPHIND